MKLKALVLTLAIAALGVSVAAATASPKHGKPPHPGVKGPKAPKAPKAADACRGPQVVLKGTYVSGSADSAGVGSFAMLVQRTNHRGRKLGLVAGTQVSVNVDARTRFRRRGHASLADLLANDRLNVKARACKSADQPPAGDGSGTGSGSDQPSNPAPAKGKGHSKRHKADLAAGSFTLLARKVDAHPPKAPKGDGGTTTGDTGTTGTTTDETDSVPTTTDGSGS
jgi:hypothetical protein